MKTKSNLFKTDCFEVLFNDGCITMSVFVECVRNVYLTYHKMFTVKKRNIFFSNTILFGTFFMAIDKKCHIGPSYWPQNRRKLDIIQLSMSYNWCWT